MSSLNKTQLIGYLGADPEVRYFSDGTPAASVSLATTETWKERESGERKESTEWHRLNFRAGLAEVVAKHLVKGSRIYVEGKLKTRKYDDKQGVERYVTEVHVSELLMLGGKRKEGSDAPSGIGEDDIAF